MQQTNFLPTEKVYLHDRIFAATILKLFPKKVLPNHITVFRFLATPVVVVLMLAERYYIGLIAFLLVALTDAIDGSMARTRNQITRWGQIYDPLADKFLVGSMIFIIVLRYIDFWTAIIILGLDFIILIIAWIRKSHHLEIKANIWGKIKMNLQVAGVVILLFAIVFDWASLMPLASGVLYLAIAFATVSLLTYGL
ncbi:MAG: CDP-alcohol phosphatidyltransferase family protein [Patescibacteria group bacterium]